MTCINFVVVWMVGVSILSPFLSRSGASLSRSVSDAICAVKTSRARVTARALLQFRSPGRGSASASGGPRTQQIVDVEDADGFALIDDEDR